MPNGSTMPIMATVADSRALRLTSPASISRPTRKRKRQRPILATRLRKGRDSSGKMCSVNPGIRPNAVGPAYIYWRKKHKAIVYTHLGEFHQEPLR